MEKDLIQAQKELINKYWPQILDENKKLESTNMMIHAIIKELSELSDGYSCFPWSKPKNINKKYMLEEITDIFHFVLELYIIWGVTTFEEVFDLYLKKRSKNINRGKIHLHFSN